MSDLELVRSTQLRAVGTAFLRTRPWVVAPVAALNLGCLVAAGAPRGQIVGMGAGIAALLSFFVHEAIRYRTIPVREDQLWRSLAVTAGALLLACAGSGGPRSPMVPLLLAPVGVAFAAFGRDRGNARLLAAVVAGLGLLALLPAGVPFPPLAAGPAAVMTVGAAAGALTLLWIGVSGLTEAYRRSGEALARARGAALDAMRDRMRDAESLGARVAHEIRNPLTAIKGLVQLLARAEREERERRRLEVVLAEVGRVEETLSAYLRFARPLAELRAAPCEVDEVLRDLAALLEARAASGGVRIVLEVGAARTIVADRRRLQEALLNLASNAIEAMPAGGALTLAASRGAAGVQIEVRDEGRGMSAEQLAALGTPFVTGRAEGTGLGVALARAVVVQHGGRLRYSSEPGRGTRVLVELPEEPGGPLPPESSPPERGGPGV